ncbi:MFS transporter [Halalkalibacillus halophilus]|uniref:MFS transporter n=1 Tax=Halalkalibacillus halophilus TaxID=392827 RepID=UPI00040162F5|nr:MFS transporter [Halalkalibacillus halophilus]
MLQKNKAPNTPFYYGWMIVFVSALSVFFSGPGQTFAISIFIDFYIEEFDYSRSFVSGLYSAATLCAGFLLFTVGKLADIYGQRRMMVIIGSALAFAALWNALIVGPIMMFFGFFMLRLFGQGSMTLLPNTLVPQWFMEKRGRALSVMAIGGFAGAAFIPPVNAYLIQLFDWRVAWGIWSASLALIFVPLALIFVRDKPEDIGEQIDGPVKPRRKRGVSRFPLFLSISVSSLILLTLIPPIDSYLMNTFGWFPETFWRILLFTVSFIAVMLVIKKRHQLKGKVGEDLEEPLEPSKSDQEVSWTLKEAMKTRAFWLILFCVSVPALTNTGITFHLVSISEGKGLTPEVAAMSYH